MGYPTDFIGHIDIEPALNADEIAYLTAFTESRRFTRPGGPYDVPGNPRAEQAGDFDPHLYNQPSQGQPGLWCAWEACWEGCCLAYDGSEKFYGAATWLTYLIDHFLKPGALASRSADDRFAGFSFDHALDGMVVGCRRDNKQLFAITVKKNRVREEILRRADRRLRDLPPLPYEEEIDRALSPRQTRRGDRDGQVLPFVRRPGA